MTNALLKLAVPLMAAFALAGCAAHKQALHEATVKTAIALSATDDFQMVAGCSGDKGRAGVLSYSDSLGEARLSLVDGNKVTVVPVKDDPANPNAAFQKLNDWCYPK